MTETTEDGPNVLQFMFTVMWQLTESMPDARKMLTAVAEAYNRRMDEINGRAPSSLETRENQT